MANSSNFDRKKEKIFIFFVSEREKLAIWESYRSTSFKRTGKYTGAHILAELSNLSCTLLYDRNGAISNKMVVYPRSPPVDQSPSCFSFIHHSISFLFSSPQDDHLSEEEHEYPNIIPDEVVLDFKCREQSIRKVREELRQNLRKNFARMCDKTGTTSKVLNK